MSFQQDIKGVEILETPPLPPGFRFHPTDEELVSYYLTEKVLNSNFIFQAIGEVDFNKCEPWDLREMAKMSESMFYFFSLRDRKYPTGMRTNRATDAGYWKATGKDRDVMSSTTGRLVGMKKTLVFYTGRAPKGEKTNWIMHEYRLEDESTPHQQEWVVCRVFEKSGPGKKVMPANSNDITSSYNAHYSNSQSLPGLQNLEPLSPNSVRQSNYTYTGLTLSDPPQGYFQGATIPGHDSIQILRRTMSSVSGRRDNLQLGESLDTLLSGWDNMYPLEWTGDGGAGH